MVIFFGLAAGGMMDRLLSEWDVRREIVLRPETGGK